MIKKLSIALAALGGTLCVLPIAANATGTTTGEDSVSTVAEETVPTECIEFFTLGGPARLAHSAARPGIVIDAPDCADIEGLCVEIVFPAGPSRAPHGVRTTPVEPCVPAGPACDISVPYEDPSGPARAAHQPSKVVRPQGMPYMVIDIPTDCQDVLSGLAIPSTGSDSSNIIWLGAVLVGVGAVLVTTRRVATVRSR